MATVQKKTVLITGCSTGGIGWAMAKIFHERGFYVFATARDPSKAADLSELSNVEILELDVTVPQTILQCKETVTKRTGGKLDVLVNNAGVEFIRPLLDVDVAEAKRLYDVNVWGPLTMIQAFAPLLIEATISLPVDIISPGRLHKGTLVASTTAFSNIWHISLNCGQVQVTYFKLYLNKVVNRESGPWTSGHLEKILMASWRLG